MPSRWTTWMLVMLLGGCCYQGVSEGGGGTGASASGGSNASAGASGGTGGSGGAAGGSSGGGSTGSGNGSGAGTTGAPQGPAAVMIVQDLSGENCEPLARTDGAGTSCVGQDGYCSACVPGNGNCPSAACQSSLQITQTALQAVLGAVATAANLQLGLTVQPGPGAQGGAQVCATGVTVLPVGPGHAKSMERAYAGMKTSGGSPTAETLLGPVAADPVMKGAGGSLRRYVLLIAGGVPNCNASNPCATEAWSDGNVYGCASPAVLLAKGVQASPPAGCSCSWGTCTEASQLTCCPDVSSGLGQICTDGPASVAAVAALYQNLGIVTYVVGVGPVAKAYGTVFDAMAAAGHGSPAHLQADDEASLETILQQLLAQLAG